jgi:hypothetical protein
MDERIRQAHAAAEEAGQDAYIDPETGLIVMTEGFLRRRGWCCGNICRHCPYEHAGPAATGGPVPRS